MSAATRETAAAAAQAGLACSAAGGGLARSPALAVRSRALEKAADRRLPGWPAVRCYASATPFPPRYSQATAPLTAPSTRVGTWPDPTRSPGSALGGAPRGALGTEKSPTLLESIRSTTNCGHCLNGPRGVQRPTSRRPRPPTGCLACRLWRLPLLTYLQRVT